MEQQSKSFLPKFMSIIMIAMGIFLGIYAFFAHADTWVLPGGLTWDSNRYLDASFRANNPTDNDIISALYIDDYLNSAYAKGWDGGYTSSCTDAGMTVQHLTGGVDVIDPGLLPNTIYVFNSGTYVFTNPLIINDNCIAMVGRGDVYIYASGAASSNIIDSSDNKRTIFDNLTIDGKYSSTSQHDYLLGMENITSSTLNNLRFLHAGETSIYADSVANMQINNNSFIYGNIGIQFNNVSFSTINNSFFEKLNYGMYIDNSSYNYFNNLSISNTYPVAIALNGGDNNNLFNSLSIYDNPYGGISLEGSNLGNLYFGSLTMFNNSGYDFAGTNGNDSSLRPGNGVDLASIGRTTGKLYTGFIMTREYAANIKNNSGTYAANRSTGGLFALGWGTPRTTMTAPVTYSMGAHISRQIQPVIYNYIDDDLSTGGSYDAMKFIGSQITDLSGTIAISGGAYIPSLGATLSLTATTPVQYRIFGTDLTSEIAGTYSTGNVTQTVTFSGTDGTKTAFVQFRNGSDRATHYAATTILDTTYPAFTGTAQSGTIATSGGYYATGITFTFSDLNLSGAVVSGVNGTNYYSGNFQSGARISTSGTYLFTVYDRAGNASGMVIIIDTTAPTFTGVASGAYYNTNVSITGNDDISFSGFQLSGIFYAGSSLTVTGEGIWILTGYDKAGNTSRIAFIIDKTAPLFTGTAQSGTLVISGGYYNTGITFTFSDLNLSGAVVSGMNGSSYYSGNFQNGAKISVSGNYLFTVIDRAGNSTGTTFLIDTVLPIVNGIYPTSGFRYTGGNIINFSRTGSDNIAISGYALYVSGTSYPAGATGYTLTLSNGTYTRYAIATDRAGNTGTSVPATFTIAAPFTGSATISGTTIQYIGSQRYTTSILPIFLWANDTATNFIMTGDITGAMLPPYTGNVYPITTWNLTLTTGDGTKTVYITIQTGTDRFTFTRSIVLDTVAPAPTLTSPGSGSTASGAFNLTRSIGTDLAGISGYQYFVSTTGSFATVVKSGSTNTATTSVALANMELGTTGTFYRYVRATDRLGNVGTSAIQSFTYSGADDITPDAFSFNHITSARLDRVYGSNTVTITGLSANTPVLASVSKGVLYISGNMVGKTGYVQNGRIVQIELISSDEYDTDVTSTLTINTVSAVFRITTETEDEANDSTDYSDISTDLSSTERLQIIAIFEALRDLYGGLKQDEFFDSLMVMLQSKIDALGTSSSNDSKRDALQYLYDLADQYRGGGTSTDIASTSRIVNGVYTAPNGKRYTITYDSVRKQFTSTNFITPKYYPTLDVLKYDIDRNNPVGSKYANAKTIKARRGRVSIDGTRQTSAYTAPNHKVFYFFKTTEGQYSSYTFTTEKYFDSLEKVKEHIYNNNRK